MADATKDIFDAATFPVRPLLHSQLSNSVPSTPRQHALEFQDRARSPSPRKGARAGSLSPRSVCSESNQVLPSLRSVAPTCRYMSTQTSRRRIPYSIGADPLENEGQSPKVELETEEEKKLSEDMRGLYEELLPTEDSQARREQAVQKLNDILQGEWPDKQIKVSMFGSSGNLLFTTYSDVDVCVTMKGLETVCLLADVLARRGMKRVTCVHAKAVPIVKIWDPELLLACDLNVNNHIAIQNTHLVRVYMEIDDRVRTLAMIVKYWTNRRLINEASGGTLSSYCWTLLVINYLQTRNPPILPVVELNGLDGLPKKEFEDEVERFRNFGKTNHESIGQLLFHFFRYYSYEINYDTAVISVRTGKLLSKKDKNWHFTTNNRLCVEEPFNTDRNLGNTADDTAFRGIHMEIRQAFSRVADAKDLKSSVCEKFEFPLDEPRMVFERPQPQSRPVLSRSTSQTGRGGRHTATVRTPKQHFNHRSGPSNRRASNPAAYNVNAHPVYQNGQVIVQQGSGSEYYLPGQPIRGLHDQLSQLSHQLSVEEGRLRYQQMLMSQASLQAAGLAPLQARGMMPRNPPQQIQRPFPNGYPSPHSGNMENTPGNTHVQKSFPSSPRHDQASLNTQVQPQQNSDSPLAAAAANVPSRRGLQRSNGPMSPGASRSQSQPARPAQEQLLPLMYPTQQYAYSMPNGQLVMPDQLTASHIQRFGYPTHIISPYTNLPVDVAMTEPTQREYLGYGIGGNMPIGAAYALGSSYGDMHSQARRTSPQVRTESPEFYADNRTSSPADLLNDATTGLSASVPLLDIDSGAKSLPNPQPNFTGPLIVNGSTRPARSSSEVQRLKDNEVMQRLPMPQHVISNSRAQIDFARMDIVGQSSSKPPHAIDGLREQLLGHGKDELRQGSGSNGQHNSIHQAIGSDDLRHTRINGSPQSDNHPPPAEFSFDSIRLMKPSSDATGRPSIPPLDLSGSVSRVKELSSVLSPVQELKIPSPSITRKPELQSNGISNCPTPEKKSQDNVHGKENINGVHSRTNDAMSANNNHTVLPRLPIVQPQSLNNAWQPVSKKGGNKKGKGRDQAESSSDVRSRGETLPAQESERKGG